MNLGSERRRIEPGERIAQLVVARVARADWRSVEPGSEEQEALAGGRAVTARGPGGFGHTGRGGAGEGT